MLKPHFNHFKDSFAIQKYKISPEEEGLTIYQVLRHRLKVSRGLLRKLRHNYRVRINGLYQVFEPFHLKNRDLDSIFLVFLDKWE